MLVILNAWFFSDKYIHSVESLKTVWPFNSEIIRKSNKYIFMGQANDGAGGNLVQHTDEKIITDVKLLDGYDFTEFIAYSLLGYIVVKLIRKKEENLY